jgi:hypothetical protein
MPARSSSISNTPKIEPAFTKIYRVLPTLYPHPVPEMIVLKWNHRHRAISREIGGSSGERGVRESIETDSLEAAAKNYGA